MTSVRQDLIDALRQYEEEEKRKRASEVAKEAAKGFAKGAMGAVYDVANGATFGGLEKIDEKYLNGAMENLNNELENDAGTAGVGDIYQGLKTFNESIGTGLGLFGAKNVGEYGLNEAVKYKGRRDLRNQLEQGENFRDINFGKMNKDTLGKINKLREEGGYEPLNSQTYIPANVIRKWYKKRLSEGYTPQDVSNIASDLFHGGNNTVTTSRYPHIQQVIKPQENTSGVGYIAQNPNNGQTVIKSVYRKPNTEIRNSILNNNTAYQSQNVNNFFEDLLEKLHHMLGY